MEITIVDNQISTALNNLCKAYGEKTAFRFEDRAITFDDYLGEIERFKGRLIELGVRRGSEVVFLSSDLLETVIGYFACLFIGAVSIPIDLSLDNKMMKEIVTRIVPQFMLVSTEFEIRLPDILDRRPEKKIAVSPNNFLCLIERRAGNMSIEAGDHLMAFVFFTSGSTGSPKGVLITQNSLHCFMNYCPVHFGIKDDDVVLCHAPLHTDMSLFALFVSLAAGACCVLIPPRQRTNPYYMKKVIKEAGVTLLHVVPSTIALLIQSGLGTADIQTVKYLLITGEKTNRKLLMEARQLFGQCQIHNIYGSTEVNDAFSYLIPSSLEGLRSTPMGKPYDYVRPLILHDDLSVCRMGEIGELFIQSDTLMHGYYGKESEKIFVNLPDYHGHYYATGDLVQYDGDQYYCIGRKDDRVKINGKRVYLNHIEEVLFTHPEIIDATVVALEENDSLVITAYILSDRVMNTLEVRSHCSTMLPPYSIPQRIIIMEQPIPRTSTGKHNKQLLKKQRLEEV